MTEIMHLLRFLLRMSLNPIDCGGYQVYFIKADIEIQLDFKSTIKAVSTGGWASDTMD